MQLVEVGRNDPCSCGSGRKYKKCCLAAREGALAGQATEINASLLVDEAIASDDWDAIHVAVDHAMEVFDGGAPLEHVRFRDDLIGVSEDDIDVEKLCVPGWLARCELEIAHVLARFALEPEIRDGMRIAAHLVRRFGARSPIVEELARLQVAESVARHRRLANAMSSRGITVPDMNRARSEIAAWLEGKRPPILSFAEWFALRAAPDTALETIWLSGIARSVTDTCLDRLENAPDDAPSCAALAGVVGMPRMAQLGRYLAQETPVREPTGDEQIVYDSLKQGGKGGKVRDGIMLDIVRAAEIRADFAGAALIRESMRVVQIGRPRPPRT